MLDEFKKFIAQGNVLDLAVGVIIGGAFGKIVNSLVNDIIMPIIGLLLKGVNVAQQFIALDGNSYANLEEAKKYDASADEFYELAKAWGDDEYAQQAKLAILELRRNIQKIDTHAAMLRSMSPRDGRASITSAESIETPLPPAQRAKITDAITW